MASKQFQCGTLVRGCDWHTRNNSEAEIIRRAREHLRGTHGETVIRENMIKVTKARIEQNKIAA